MKKSLLFILIMILATIFSFTVNAQERSASIDSLAWMTGCWQTELDGATLEEHWSRPAGGTLIGFSRVIEKNQTIFIEYSSIHIAGADVFYTATLVVSGKSTSFKLVHMDSLSVVFSNPEHDFPKKIIYRRDSGEALSVHLEGDENSKTKAEEYVIRRSPCQ